MCLALPARLIELLGDERGVVDLGGIRKQVSTALVPGAVVGDYVIVHVGHAIGQIDPVEAERTLALFGELAADPASAAALETQR
jgi:hydrogenase expression/formation protein HypC